MASEAVHLSDVQAVLIDAGSGPLAGESALGTTTSQIWTSPGSAFGAIASLSDYGGAALQINASANPSAGNSPVDITVLYRKVPVA